jgi:hypothetical protein
MSKHACLGVVFATAVLLACGTRVTYTQLNTPPAQMVPRHAAGVQVFTTGAPQQPFVEVGLLEAQQESAYSQDRQPQILDKLRQRAAEVGCDGIILLGSNDSVVGSVSGGMGWTTTLAGYRATCIMFYQPWSGGQPQPTYPQQPPGQPQTIPCTRDVDCPGNGICERGVCIAG